MEIWKVVVQYEKQLNEGVAVMEDLSHDQRTTQTITTRLNMSIADLKEEAELDKVDFETLMEEIRVSWLSSN